MLPTNTLLPQKQFRIFISRSTVSKAAGNFPQFIEQLYTAKSAVDLEVERVNGRI